MTELLMIVAAVALCVAYRRHKKRQFWLMQREWARKEREFRLEQGRLDMEKGLQILNLPTDHQHKWIDCRQCKKPFLDVYDHCPYCRLK